MFSIWLEMSAQKKKKHESQNSIFKRFISTTFWFSRTISVCATRFEYFTHLAFDFLAFRFVVVTMKYLLFKFDSGMEPKSSDRLIHAIHSHTARPRDTDTAVDTRTDAETDTRTTCVSCSSILFFSSHDLVAVINLILSFLGISFRSIWTLDWISLPTGSGCGALGRGSDQDKHLTTC